METPAAVTDYLRGIGRKGGKGSLKTMTKEERKERARQAGIASGKVRKANAKKAAAARWGKK